MTLKNKIKGTVPVYVVGIMATATIGYAAWVGQKVVDTQETVAVQGTQISDVAAEVNELKQDHDIIIKIAEKFNIPTN